MTGKHAHALQGHLLHAEQQPLVRQQPRQQLERLEQQPQRQRQKRRRRFELVLFDLLLSC